MVEAEERTLLGGTIIGENNNDEVCSILSTDCCGTADCCKDATMQADEDAIKAQTVDRVNVWIDTSIWPDTTFYKEDTNQEGAATGGGDDLLPSSKRSGLNAKGK
eukprot:scaffold891_cov89-Skeletonema_dohrnii-CCMP3373.AAC.3